MPDPNGRLAGFDAEAPNVARMYDFMLGGKDNYACDRQAVGMLTQMAPEAPLRARQNREFLGRAVRYVAGQGVSQFLDVGAGLPTQDNVHQVARMAVPDARTVYVDNDPVVLAHARALLSTDSGTTVVAGDVREPVAILGDPQTRAQLDFARPVCVLLVAVLHFVPDSDLPDRIVAAFRDAIAPGSYLILSHASMDGAPPAEAARVGDAEAVYEQATAPLIMRDTKQVTALLDGFSVVDPGIVHVTDWRSAAPSRGFDAFLAAVGRKDT